MKTRLNIKNFRIFDEDGAIFELNPITILTGCNSSGKSSMVKAVMLLNSFLSQIKKDIDNNNEVELSKYKLDFTQYPMNLLGRFDKVVNDKSESPKVTIEYTVYSLIISKDVDVKLVFSADEHDDLNNAYLENISVCIDGEILYSSDKKDKESVCNFNLVKESCMDFMMLISRIEDFLRLEECYEFEGTISKSEYDEKRREIILHLKELDKQRVRDTIKYVRTSKENKRNWINKKTIEIIEWSKDNNSLFKIPLLDTLDKFKKEEISQFINKEFLTNVDDARLFVSNKIINEYINSDFDLFSAYFRHYENMFLNEVASYHSFVAFPKIFVPHDYKISQDYIYINPFNPPILVIGGEDDKKEDNNLEIEEWKREPISFNKIYGMLMEWNEVSKPVNEDVYYSKAHGYDINENYYHIMFTKLKQCVALLIKEVISPEWCGSADVEYVSSSRVKISRLYSLDVNDDFTNLLKRYFESKRENAHIARKRYIAGDFANKWIKLFGIGERLSIKYDDEGLGATIRLYKNPEDKNGKLLSDEGYGITQLVSILLQIETAILSANGEFAEGWFGMQSIDSYDYTKFHYEMKTICIEEPEIHLHPKYQSLLADMFVEAYRKYNIHFIIETHSEYLIRKLQTMVASKSNELVSDEVSIYYIVSNDECDGGDKVRKINIMEDGRLSSPFGTGFFDEADNLAMELLNIKLG